MTKKVKRTAAKELNILELESHIHSQVQQEVDKTQREYFLREQLKAIQRELVAKQVDHPVAVGADRASRNAEVLNIIDSGSDLLHRPGVAAIWALHPLG